MLQSEACLPLELRQFSLRAMQGKEAGPSLLQGQELARVLELTEPAWRVY